MFLSKRRLCGSGIPLSAPALFVAGLKHLSQETLRQIWSSLPRQSHRARGETVASGQWEGLFQYVRGQAWRVCQPVALTYTVSHLPT